MSSATHEGYFEDFRVGDVFEHPRGRTVTDMDNYVLTHMSMNTASAHFDLQYARGVLDGAFPERIVLGPATIAIVVGLTSQDMSEQAFLDLGLTGLRLPAPVFAGDTLRATSEVVSLRDDDRHADRGILSYRFVGTNQEGRTVVEGERTVAIKRRHMKATLEAGA